MTRSDATPGGGLKTALYVLAAFGVALAAFIELSHIYPALMELCGGASSGCADVTSTPFAKIFDVSVAYWGVLGYIVFLFALYYKPSLALPLASAMMGAELYFLWVMAAVIHIFCTFCLIQFVTVLALFIVTLLWNSRTADYFLPGGIWSAPAVVIVACLALVAPVQLSAGATYVESGELVTYSGDKGSNLRVEIFSDYECGHCRKFEPEIEKLLENHPDALVVFRDYLIPSHQISPRAAAYANFIAFTKGHEEFVKTRSEIFENQKNIYDYIKAKLEDPAFKNALTDDLKKKINEKVERDMNRAHSLGIYSTPSIVIYRDGKIVQKIAGFSKYEQFARFLKN